MTDNNSTAVPLEDICIDLECPTITTPIPCPRFSATKLDPLEYFMGYSRGEMDELCKTETSFNMTVRQDVFERLCKTYCWGIIHTQEELEHILAFFYTNSEAAVKDRVSYTTEFPTQPSYTYRLFFNDKRVQLHLPDGRPCISGQTLVTTTLHPCLAICLAVDFLVHNRPYNIDKATSSVLRSSGMVIFGPIWLSWFQNRPRLATPRPEARAVRDRPTPSK